ncbi:MAG TPA: hypothetical protein VF157_01975 [Chloroflexota bacterium]
MSTRAGTDNEVQIEIISYAPTEFFHCQHCEMVWGNLDLGQKLHAEQRETLLPPDLQAQYAAIDEWAAQAMERYGGRLRFKLVDAVSIEGFLKSLRHRSRKFPVFVINGSERLSGFDRHALDEALDRHFRGEVVGH